MKKKKEQKKEQKKKKKKWLRNKCSFFGCPHFAQTSKACSGFCWMHAKEHGKQLTKCRSSGCPKFAQTSKACRGFCWVHAKEDGRQALAAKKGVAVTEEEPPKKGEPVEEEKACNSLQKGLGAPHAVDKSRHARTGFDTCTTLEHSPDVDQIIVTPRRKVGTRRVMVRVGNAHDQGWECSTLEDVWRECYEIQGHGQCDRLMPTAPTAPSVAPTPMQPGQSNNAPGASSVAPAPGVSSVAPFKAPPKLSAPMIESDVVEVGGDIISQGVIERMDDVLDGSQLLCLERRIRKHSGIYGGPSRMPFCPRRSKGSVQNEGLRVFPYKGPLQVPERGSRKLVRLSSMGTDEAEAERLEFANDLVMEYFGGEPSDD
jgi:hypothetical protein